MQQAALHVGIIQPARIMLHLSIVPAGPVGQLRLMMPFFRVDSPCIVKFVRPNQSVESRLIDRPSRKIEIVQIGGYLLVVVFSVDLKDHPAEVGPVNRRRGIRVQVQKGAVGEIKSNGLPLIQDERLDDLTLGRPGFGEAAVLQFQGDLVGLIPGKAVRRDIGLQGKNSLFRQVEMAANVEAHIGVGAAGIGVFQDRSRRVDALRKGVGKGRIYSAIVGVPGCDGAIAFKIVANGRPLGKCRDKRQAE